MVQVTRSRFVLLIYGVHSQLLRILTVTTKPKLPDLCEYFVPRYAIKWKDIGRLLGVPEEELDIIGNDNQYKAKPCCVEMLKWWLRSKTEGKAASWGRLFTAVESPAVSTVSSSQEG